MSQSCEEIYPLYDENSKCDVQLLAQLVNTVCEPNICGRYLNPTDCNNVPGCSFDVQNGGNCKNDGTVARTADPDDCSSRCCKNLYMEYFRKCILEDPNFQPKYAKTFVPAAQSSFNQLYQTCQNQIDFDVGDIFDHGSHLNEGEGMRTVENNFINRTEYNYDCNDQIIYCGQDSDARGERLKCSSNIPFDVNDNLKPNNEIRLPTAGHNEYGLALEQLGDCPVGYEPKSDDPNTFEGIEGVTIAEYTAPGGERAAWYRRCARKQGWDCNNLYGPGH